MTAFAKDLEPSQESRDLVPTASGSLEHPQLGDVPLGSVRAFDRGDVPNAAIQDANRSATEPILAAPELDLDTVASLQWAPSPRVLPLPPVRFTTRSRFLPLQKWEGTVLSVRAESFVARLVDKTSDAVDAEAELPLSDVTVDDLALVQPGAVFYWTVGYSMDLSGSRRRVAEMRFRRLPVWTKRDLEQARSAADRTIEDLGWNE